MGWWEQKEKEADLIIGDEPLDAVGQMLDIVDKSYQEEVGRKLTQRELCKTLEIVLSARMDIFDDVSEDMKLASIVIKLKPQPKRQKITRGDYFYVPLPSGGYGYGRVIKIFMKSVLLLDFLEVHSWAPLSFPEVRARKCCSGAYVATLVWLSGTGESSAMFHCQKKKQS